MFDIFVKIVKEKKKDSDKRFLHLYILKSSRQREVSIHFIYV